jgi:hypothetical protein
LDCFQSSSEDLNSYKMAVVAAAEILGFEGGGGVLADSPHTTESSPSGQGSPFIHDKAGVGEGLYALATTVGEGVAIKEQR